MRRAPVPDTVSNVAACRLARSAGCADPRRPGYAGRAVGSGGGAVSVATLAYKNFVGGKWVDSVEGGTMDVLNPATGETIAEVPRGTQADVDRAVEAAQAALPGWLAKTPEGSRRGAAEARRPDRRARRGAGRARVAQRGQAALDRPRRDALLGRQPALLRRRRAGARGQGGRRVRGGLHLHRPPRAARHRGRHHALELPADDGGLEARAGARGRQRPDPQAGRADAADHAPLRRAGPGRAAAGRAQRHHRRRRPGRLGPRRCARDRARLADRRRRDRQDDRGQCGPDAQARAPRARREGPHGGARRRRPRRRGRGDQDRRLLELGPGLHRLLAHPRQRAHLRRRALRDGRRGGGHEGRRPRRGGGDRDGPCDLARSSGSACSASSSAWTTARPS